jgi:hypothetical protein
LGFLFDDRCPLCVANTQETIEQAFGAPLLTLAAV